MSLFYHEKQNQLSYSMDKLHSSFHISSKNYYTETRMKKREYYSNIFIFCTKIWKHKSSLNKNTKSLLKLKNYPLKRIFFSSTPINMYGDLLAFD